MMMNAISNMGNQLSKSFGIALTLALAPLAAATQSVAPVAVSSIPITQVVEKVVPSGVLPHPPPPAPVIHMAPPVVPHLEQVVSSDSDSDSDSNKKPSERKTKRRRWCSKLYDYLDDVEKPAEPVPDQSGAWWGSSITKSTSHDYPTLPLHKAVMFQLDSRVKTHFNQIAKGERKKFNPSKAYNVR